MLAAGTPNSRNRASSCDELGSNRVMPFTSMRPAGPKNFMRRKLRSDNRALIAMTGTLRRFA